LALPPSILADIIEGGNEGEAAQARSGAYFGVWNFVTKLNLALAAGVALPLLQFAGYTPGQAGGEGALILAYACAPLVLKLLAAALLWRHRSTFIHQGSLSC
jgi:Na+/melibiose symporter-like transporter